MTEYRLYLVWKKCKITKKNVELIFNLFLDQDNKRKIERKK